MKETFLVYVMPLSVKAFVIHSLQQKFSEPFLTKDIDDGFTVSSSNALRKKEKIDFLRDLAEGYRCES